MPSERGDSAVVVPVAGVEPLVARWRERFDRSAAEGMPPHITVLSPFLPETRLTGPVITQLASLFAATSALDIEFRRLGRFPGVVYLDPEPAGELRSLTTALAAHWPEAPPYGGNFAEVVPHLTIANGADDEVLAKIEADVRRRLPVRARLAEGRLYVFGGSRWQLRARLPFAGL